MSVVIKGSSNINLDFTTGGRITGDFSNATLANRVMFQTSTTDGTTGVGVIPNGTALSAAINLFGNSDITNTAFAQFRVGNDTGDVRISSSITGTGTYRPMTFYTGGGERVRIDTSGNVGIGTSSPASMLHVTGVTTLSTTRIGPEYIELGSEGTGDRNSYIDFHSSGIPGAIDHSARIIRYPGVNGEFSIGNTGSGSIRFEAGGSERARIDSSGNFGVGATSLAYRFQVQANVSTYSSYLANENASPYGLYIQHNGASPNSAGNEFLTCWDTTANRFRINSNGGIANFQANDVNLSDRREKTNFAPAKSYLDTICAIPVQTFNYIDQNMEDDPSLTLGVIAQDVQAVAPELVMESNWGTEENPKQRLSIYQTDLQYALMKCIQEQQAMIEQLKADVAALKGTV
jgi:hypothetical protein